ncbi:MAG: phosphate ABC transporter permease PstA [Alphaproteobacteria bacterium]|nr:phosphate ABC transporter permease PstA [Alphaproteobacteria bacterium]
MTSHSLRKHNQHLEIRLNAEKRFRWYGRAALGFAVLVLVLLIGSLFLRGAPGFVASKVILPVQLDAALLDMDEGRHPGSLPPAAYNRMIQQALKAQFPEVTQPSELRRLYGLVSASAGLSIKRLLQDDSKLLGTTQTITLYLSSHADLYFKGQVDEAAPESERRLSNQQISWLKQLESKGMIQLSFNELFLSEGDSRTPERAGFLGAMVGSALTLIICLLVAFPLGVATAVYLEEFAGKGRFVDIIEVNINNLAAVPSIVFGLLGLSIYINVMGLPRSAALVGGATLALMVLPVIIIATRSSLRAIPDSIRDAARALGASPLQVVWHHTLPLSMPGIMTGTILGMARAIGETAPLLMIGMVAFVADVPRGFTDPATAMPVQIFLWASSPEAGFAEKTAAGILVLLVLLLAMNALAIYLRKKFEVRW